ncbi:MAG: hypothetical protein AAGK78_08955 [Planctomycetota bacterium]
MNNQADDVATLEYADDRPRRLRGQLLKLMFVLIAAKIVMVLLNLILMFSDVPTWLQVAGAGVQVALTLAFLAVLFKLVSVR